MSGTRDRLQIDSARPTLSRRSTLQWIVATSLGAALPRWIGAATLNAPAASDPPNLADHSVGYGTDPNLANPVVPWSRTMTEVQLERATKLADAILPATSNAPAPSELGVMDFIDEWISAPYPEQRHDRATILDGLNGPDPNKLDPQSAFFQRFRHLVVTAYYTTPEGFKDIGYTGNVPLLEYPPITEEERGMLDKALARLGIHGMTSEEHS